MPYPRPHKNQGLDLHQALPTAGTSINAPSFQRSETHQTRKKLRTLIKKELLILAMADAMLHETCIKS
jgi:hypothetical protein